MFNQSRIGLSLSGGGYRASVFHLGTLKKLDELKILDKIDVLSTISGGSITGAAWCLYEGDYISFHNKMVEKFKTKNVIRHILFSFNFLFIAILLLLFIGSAIALTFTRLSGYSFPILIVFLIIIFYLQFKMFPVSKLVESAYDKFFYDKKKLRDLKSKPRVAIGSSNLETGRPFTFSQAKMADSGYAFNVEYNPPIHFKHEDFPIARAVAASSCVPFAFTPITINKEFFADESDFKRVNPKLVDGGVYDNQGIQKLTQPQSSYECDIIITSDAGGNFAADKKYRNTITLLTRTVDLFMYRIKASQMVQNVYRNVSGRAKPIAYFSLGWRIQNAIPGFISNMIQKQVLPDVIAAHQFHHDWFERPADFKEQIKNHLEKRLGYSDILKRDLTDDQWELARTSSTNLKPLSEENVNYLIRHAENMTEIQVKLYCPSLIDQS